MSWKAEVRVKGEEGFHGNGLRFESKRMCQEYAMHLAARWVLVVEWRAIPSKDKVNAVFDGVGTRVIR